MEGWNQLRAAVVVDAAAQPRDRIERPQQRPCREGTERDDHLRLDDVDLLKQKRLARLDFVLLGIAVARRTALDDVGDINVLALEIDRFDDLRQQLTGTPDERNALNVFVAPGRFADGFRRR